MIMMNKTRIEENFIKNINFPIIVPESVQFKKEQYEEILLMQEIIKGYRKFISKLIDGGLVINESSLLDQPMIFLHDEKEGKLIYKLTPRP